MDFLLRIIHLLARLTSLLMEATSTVARYLAKKKGRPARYFATFSKVLLSTQIGLPSRFHLLQHPALACDEVDCLLQVVQRVELHG